MSTTSGQSWSHETDDDASADSNLRVILVGRTGLEAVLRRDDGVELLRVRSALEAVGELADPIDTTSPRRAAVIVASEADPADGAGAFVAALKLVDPDVAAILVSSAQRPAGPQAFEGFVSPSATAAEVRRAVTLARTGPRPDLVQVKPTPATSPAPPAPPGPTRDDSRPAPHRATAAASATTSAGTPAIVPDSDTENEPEGERPLLAALLQGRDVLVPALARARHRSQDDSLRFVATKSESAFGAPPEHAVAVMHGSKVFGWLTGSAPHDTLHREATRLAAWLALAEQQAALRAAAMHDDLTGAYNRRYFDRYVRSALEQAQKNRQTLTLLIFDLDGFKGFNDRFGHPAGDEILRETVRLLRSVIRPGDKVCRIGGDEFAVVFYEPAGQRDPASKPPEDVAIIARRFQEQVRAHRFPKLADCAPGSLTISGGLATFPWDGRTLEELLKHADDLALAAKRDGKNAIRFGPGGKGGAGGAS